ncbi:MAG: hypothetical protein WAT31_01250 [Candidatus Saccharimonas aalborgensis]
MAFGNSKARIAALEAQNDQLTQLFARADVRLDRYPQAITGIFGDTLTDSSAGRWTAYGSVGDTYRVDVSNVPGKEQVVFTALKFGRTVKPHVIALHPGEPVDFDADDFEMLEAWVQSARTGVLPDPGRHEQRAAKMFSLVG